MTSDVDLEWQPITEGVGDAEHPIWQHRDNWNAWSLDAGKTYYLINEPLLGDGTPPLYDPAVKPVPPQGAPVTLEQAVFQALGTASMCWDEPPSGVFDSDRATDVGNDLVEWIRERYTKKEHESA